MNVRQDVGICQLVVGGDYTITGRKGHYLFRFLFGLLMFGSMAIDQSPGTVVNTIVVSESLFRIPKICLKKTTLKKQGLGPLP